MSTIGGANNLSVGGLASGLDTNHIIDGLVGLEQQRVTTEQNKVSAYQVKLSTFNDLGTKLKEFNDKATSLDDVNSFNIFKSTSSDETIAKITGTTSAVAGNYDLQVLNLGTTNKVASNSYASTTLALGLTGSFTISASTASLVADPTTTTMSVDLAATDTLSDIAKKINRAKGSGASASVVNFGNNDFRLMLTGVDEGSKGFTLTSTSGTTVGPTGLGIISNTKAIRSSTEFKLAAGGAAVAATKLNTLFTSIGGNSTLSVGDKIHITGTKSDGTAAAVTDFTIANTATDDVQGIMTAVQTAFGGPGSASVTLNNSGEIVIKSLLGTQTQDLTLNLSFVDSDASGSALSLGAGQVKNDFSNVVSEGKKAFYMMNGLSVSSQSNKDNTLVTGTTFELLKVSTETVKLTLDRDKDGIKKKIQEFLDSYNNTLIFIDSKSKINVTDPTKNDPLQKLNSNKQGSFTKGPFAGDSSILGLKSQLRSIMTNSISELKDMGLSTYTSFAAIGITSNQKDGSMSINDTTFNSAMDADFEGVRRLFVTGGYSTNPLHAYGTSTKDTQTGIYNITPATDQFDTSKVQGTISYATAARVESVLTSSTGDSNGLAITATTTSGTGQFTFIRGIAGQVTKYSKQINDFVNGFVSSTTKGIKSQIEDSNKKISTLELRVADTKKKLITQFANMEQAIARLQSQSSAFSGQIK